MMVQLAISFTLAFNSLLLSLGNSRAKRLIPGPFYIHLDSVGVPWGVPKILGIK